MKNIIKLGMSTIVVLTAVACTPKWDESTKKEYMDSCNKSSKEKALKDIDTAPYCECTYEKLMAKYEHPGKLSGMSEAETTEVMNKIGEECLSKLMPEIEKMQQKEEAKEEAKEESTESTEEPKEEEAKEESTESTEASPPPAGGN